MSSAPIVYFILGGPGSGKGTACARLVEDFGMVHFSAGDLLRAEGKLDTELGKKINAIVSRGDIVPSEVTVELLRQAVAATVSPNGYLIDGFPRKFDQAQMFEDGIAKAKGIVYFDCSEQTMEERLLGRAAAGEGRSDDNAEVIRRRFRVNVEQCVPVVEKYKAEGRCHVVDANLTKDEVYAAVKAYIVACGAIEAMSFGDVTTADFVIVADSRELLCHKAVLMRSSAFLRRFLESDPACTRINANNARADSMTAAIRHMYDPQAPADRALAPFRYDFSVVLSGWEISVHFVLPRLSEACVQMLLPLISRSSCVRCLRSCLKHPQNDGALRLKAAAERQLPPLLETEDQRSEWEALLAKYPAVALSCTTRRSETPHDTRPRPADSFSHRESPAAVAAAEPWAEPSYDGVYAPTPDVIASLRRDEPAHTSSYSLSPLRLRPGAAAHASAAALAHEVELREINAAVQAAKADYERALAERRAEEEHLRNLLTNIDSQDLDLVELSNEVTEATSAGERARDRKAALEEAISEAGQTIAENHEYVRSARLYVPSAREAVSQLSMMLDTVTRKARDGGDVQALLGEVLADLKRDRQRISTELQKEQRSSEALKHGVSSERDRIGGIRRQLVELS